MNKHWAKLKAYKTYYSKPLSKALKVLGVIIVMQIIGFPIGIFSDVNNSTTFMYEADRVVINYDDSFVIEDSESKPFVLRLFNRLSFNRIKDISDQLVTIEVEDITEIFGEESRSRRPQISVDAVEKMGRLRLRVVFTMDFYKGEQFLGTVSALTPRDTDAYETMKKTDDLDVFLEDCGGMRIVFLKGSQFFRFAESIYENLGKILSEV